MHGKFSDPLFIVYTMNPQKVEKLTPASTPKMAKKLAFQRLPGVRRKIPKNGAFFGRGWVAHSQHKAFEVIVLLVLLAMWQEIPSSKEEPPIYDVIEFYSGVGRIAAMANRAGFTAAAVDIDIGRDIGVKRQTRPPMDINSNAGLLFLGTCSKLYICILVVVYTH